MKRWLVGLATFFAFGSAVALGQSPPTTPNARPSTGISVPVDEDDDGPVDDSTPIGEIRNVVDALRALNAAVAKQDERIKEISDAMKNATCPNDKNGEILTSLSLLAQTLNDAKEDILKKTTTGFDFKGEFDKIFDELKKAAPNEEKERASDERIASLSDRMTSIQAALDDAKAALLKKAEEAQALADAATKTTETVLERANAIAEATNAATQPKAPISVCWDWLSRIASALMTLFVLGKAALFGKKTVADRRKFLDERATKAATERIIAEMNRGKAAETETRQDVAQSKNPAAQANDLNLF